MTKTLVITSGKGGVGKTNIGVNIAVELAARQCRTCLLDADLGLANVNLLFGLHPDKTIDDVLFQDTQLDQVVVKTDLGVDVFPGSSGAEKMANLDTVQLSRLVERFETLSGYDFFLIDTSSGISRGVISFCLAATETILVLTAEATSLADAYAVVKVLSLNNYQGTVKVLVNKCSSIAQAKKTYLHFKAVADKHLDIEIAPGGAVMFDPLLVKAVSLQYPAVALYPDSVFSQCIRALVSNLVGSDSEQELPDNLGFWSRYAQFVQSDLLLPGESQPAEPVDTRPQILSESPIVEPAGSPLPGESESGSITSERPGDGLQSSGGILGAGRLPGPAPLYGYLLEAESSGTLTLEKICQIVSQDPRVFSQFIRALVSNLVRPDSEQELPDNLGFWSRYAQFVQSDLPLPGESQPAEPVDTRPQILSESPIVEPAGSPLSGESESGSITSEPPVDGLQSCGGILGAGRLPGPAPLYGYLLEAESNGTLTLERICQIVSHDPALLGRLLEGYSLQLLSPENGQLTIEQVVRELGVESVRQFIINTATHALLQPGTAEECIAVAEIWAHSCRCGLMTESLARTIGYPYPEEAYIAGLLHDIGRLVLQARFPAIYGAHSPPYQHLPENLQAERAAAGMTHDELGAEILARWGLSSFITDAARYHGETTERIVTAFDMSRMVCLAHRLSCPSNEKMTKAVHEASELFNLSSTKIFIVMQTVNEEMNRLIGYYHIPSRQDTTVPDMEERLNQYQQQAIEFTTLQNVLSCQNISAGISGMVQSVCRGLHLLYGYGRVVCLLPDNRNVQLRAVGYPQCYGHEFINHVVFSMASKESRVVDAYHGEGLLLLAATDLRSIADRQMFRLIGGNMLLCLPLSFGENRVGLIACGLSEKEYNHIKIIQKKLETFAVRAAMLLARF